MDADAAIAQSRGHADRPWGLASGPLLGLSPDEIRLSLFDEGKEALLGVGGILNVGQDRPGIGNTLGRSAIDRPEDGPLRSLYGERSGIIGNMPGDFPSLFHQFVLRKNLRHQPPLIRLLGADAVAVDLVQGAGDNLGGARGILARSDI